MRLSHWSLLPVIQNGNPTRASASSGTSPAILTPDFVQSVQQTVHADSIPGLALAIVYKNGSSELGAWGIKDEDGTNMTTDVRYILAGSRRTDEIYNMSCRRSSISPPVQRPSSPLLLGSSLTILHMDGIRPLCLRAYQH